LLRAGLIAGEVAELPDHIAEQLQHDQEVNAVPHRGNNVTKPQQNKVAIVQQRREFLQEGGAGLQYLGLCHASNAPPASRKRAGTSAKINPEEENTMFPHI